MEEQLYIIARMEDALSVPLVLESELERRLQEIIVADNPMAKCIDILLHGEKEK
jgi:hypothetical protein